MLERELSESRPAATIKSDRIKRDLNIIEGATLIGSISSNGVNRKRRLPPDKL